jgi:hypothetical protein
MVETSRIQRITGIVASAALASVLATTTPVRTAGALPIYAQETRLPCGRCHVNPNGSGPRTAYGRAFAANGHRLPGSHRYGGRAGPRYGYRGGGYGYHGGMMGGYGPGMMGGYGPGMMGW